MLLKRTRAVLLISTLWAVAWLVVGFALAVRIFVLEGGGALSRLFWFASIIAPRSAGIGFWCGTAFSGALLAFGARGGKRHASVRLGGPLAAAIVGAVASGRLGLEPRALTALICGACGAACAVASLAIAADEHSPSNTGSRAPAT